ncbi:MAG: ComEC/Rec2 family competence protein [Rickettsiales bacterium]|nr:ComEC/Rec2 family competence protein [Rickettsiales bacterium]
MIAAKRIAEILKNQLKCEETNLRFWTILTFAAGILACFFTGQTARVIIATLTCIALLLAVIFHILNRHTKILIVFLVAFLCGFLSAAWKIYTTPDEPTKYGAREAIFDAKVRDIRLTSGDTILTLSAINPPILSLKNGLLKLKYSGNPMEFSVGSTVKIKTSIRTVSYGVFPGDKSYENYARFFGIIARGNIKELGVVDNNGQSFVDNFRKRLQSRIYEATNRSHGAGVIIAILTGNNSFIPQEQLDNIRHSGCAHILAISGLHMSVIVSFVFMIFIHIFSLFPSIALHYNTKKFAAIPAIAVCLIYLQIANVPISAFRSFIMVSLGFLALFLNRARTSMNVLFFTFLSMLVLSPERILSPSFQMSFMAVFGLISVYNSRLVNNLPSVKSRAVRYVGGILASSVIATLSTVFFEIYHFKQYAWIGLVSNIPVIPLTEFVVLPISFVGMLCNGTALGDLLYRVADFFACIICQITDYTANLHNAYLLAPQMKTWQLGIIIAGLVAVFLARSWIIKTVGMTMAVCGLISYINSPKPVLVYNQNLKNVVFLEGGKYYSVEPIKSDYLHKIWAQNLGVKEILPMSDSKVISCQRAKERIIGCEYRVDGNVYKMKYANKKSPVAVYFNGGRFVKVKD